MPHTKEKIDAEAVAQYLRKHPAFFADHPDLMESLELPAVQPEGNVVDFQQHRLGKLQSGLASLRDKYEGLLHSSRDNMSTLHQVHEAALAILRARSLERLTEFVTMDLVTLFGVDVVRVGVESPAAGLYTAASSHMNYSGLTVIAPSSVNQLLGKQRSVLLIADTCKSPNQNVDAIFASCEGIAVSAAILRLKLPSLQREGVLAFGIRIANHFHEGQGTELLVFLAQILEHRLDDLLQNSGVLGEL